MDLTCSQYAGQTEYFHRMIHPYDDTSARTRPVIYTLQICPTLINIAVFRYMMLTLAYSAQHYQKAYCKRGTTHADTVYTTLVVAKVTKLVDAAASTLQTSSSQSRTVENMTHSELSSSQKSRITKIIHQYNTMRKHQ